MTLIIVTILAFIFTILGGMFALKLKDKLHLILGFSSGAIFSVAFFDLLPESLELTEGFYDPSQVLTVTALGFISYLMIDRLFLMHSHSHDDEGHTHRGKAGAASLSVHSFLDGLSIGLAFQISSITGIFVAIAVLAHDFSDGINTVSYIVKNGGDKKEALKWLSLDALAPVFGVIASLFIKVSDVTLGLLLALFSGFFIYMSASDLIPESYHNHPVRFTTFATLFGIAVMYVVISYAGI